MLRCFLACLTVLAFLFPSSLSAETVTTLRHDFRAELFAAGFEVPWALEFLPDGRLLVAERQGTLRIVDTAGTVSAPVAGVPAVRDQGQGGLLDVALHPEFAAHGWIYLSYVEPRQNDAGEAVGYTVIDRARLRHDRLVDRERIYEVDEAFYSARDHHFGSRILFDGAGDLYFTIGDRGQRRLAQSIETPNGKVHRLHDDGRVPTDNPFVDEPGAIASIWSFGHRNPQGMALDPRTGAIWITEHGARGGDELNRIQRARNYGWPAITYGVNYDGTPISNRMAQEGMEQPVLFWNPSIAPCGIDFYVGDRFPLWKNHLLVTALAYQQLRRVHIEEDRVIHQEVIYEPGARLRDVKTGPDGLIYVALEGPGRIERLVPVD